MPPASPTARTLATLRAMDYLAEKVEQRLPIPGRFVTRDFGGFGDILAAHPGRGILLVQATSRPNVNARINKITLADLPGKSPKHPAMRMNPVRLNVIRWLAAGGRAEVWGWYKKGSRWNYRRVLFFLPDGALAWKDEEPT